MMGEKYQHLAIMMGRNWSMSIMLEHRHQNSLSSKVIISSSLKNATIEQSHCFKIVKKWSYRAKSLFQARKNGVTEQSHCFKLVKKWSYRGNSLFQDR